MAGIGSSLVINARRTPGPGATVAAEVALICFSS